MDRLLVAGAGGFLGGHFLAKTTLRSQYEIISVGREEDGARRGSGKHIRMDCGDTRKLRSIIGEVQPRLLLNLAGSTDPDFATLLRYNVEVSEAMLAVARRFPDRSRVVLIGSAAEYGTPGRGALDEQSSLGPVSLYGVSKVMQTECAAFYRRSYPDCMETVIARLFNVLGSGLSSRLALGSFSEQIATAERQGTPVRLQVGNLESRRDFLHIDDVVRALDAILVVERPRPIYVVASGTSLRIRDLVEQLIAESGHPIALEVDPSRMRNQDVTDVYGSPAALNLDTGWKPMREASEALPNILASARMRG